MKKKGSGFVVILFVMLMAASMTTTGCGKNAKDEELEELKTRLAELEESQKTKVTEEEQSSGERTKEEKAEAKEEKTESTESATEENLDQTLEKEEKTDDSMLDDDLWGTKKLKSSRIRTEGGGECEMIYEYNDDGSYTGRIQANDNDYVYYFCANGIPVKMENYQFNSNNPDGELIDTDYFYLGIPLDNSIYGSIYGGMDLDSVAWDQFGMLDYGLTYDNEGKVTNGTDIVEKTGGVSGTKYYASIEKDDQNRITKLVYGEKDKYSSEGDFQFITEFSYDDTENSVTEINYSESPNVYDAENRSYGIKEDYSGFKIVLNSHGMPEKTYYIETDGKTMREKENIRYDAYGHYLGCNQVAGRSSSIIVENTYEDGTVTSRKNDGRNGETSP